MQQRRLRPGDVLDDYCPRERRITDHAIVAMIDDTIQQTRCVVCDAEHEYKQAKVPAQRRKKAPALFKQVLDGLKAPAPPPQAADAPDEHSPLIDTPPVEPAPISARETVELRPVGTAEAVTLFAEESGLESPVPQVASEQPAPPPDEARSERVDGPFRRQLIRAALPRPEGVTPPARVIPEFTIRQPTGRPNRHGGRRRGQGQGQGQGQNAQTRFGRGGHGQRFNGTPRSGGHGHGGHGGPNGNRAGGSRRGGKKR